MRGVPACLVNVVVDIGILGGELLAKRADLVIALRSVF